LATDRHVYASTQNQALSAVLFLYRDILKVSLSWLTEVERRPSKGVTREGSGAGIRQSTHAELIYSKFHFHLRLNLQQNPPVVEADSGTFRKRTLSE
jgi:hypothetical protein